jgi:hypothetical protein
LVRRKFRTDTNEYLAVNKYLNHLKDCDPNDAKWVERYNKWVFLWPRRETNTVQIGRKAWSEDEKVALHREVNSFVREKGLDAFGPSVKPAWVRQVTKKVNEVGGSRTTDMVRSMLKRNKGPIFDLHKCAKEMKSRVDAQEDVPYAERFPESAIVVPADNETQAATTVEQEAKEEEQKDADDLALGEEQEIEEEEEEERTDNLAMDEEQDLADAIRRSEQDLLHKRKRDDEEDRFSAGSEKGLSMKRVRTKEEEDAAQAADREQLPQTQDEDEWEDDEDFEAGVHM